MKNDTNEKEVRKAAKRGLMIFETREHLRERLGDYVENAIGHGFEGTPREAPYLNGEPQEMIWYKVHLDGGISGDGSEYHIYIKKGTSENLCIFFSGGGVAWNEYTAARPVTGGARAAHEPNFYWNNLRPFTQIMNINVGITEINPQRNPFSNWSFVVITYTTGDFHVGNRRFEYRALDKTIQTLHFHGKKNFLESMEVAKRLFDAPKKILIAGDSAGGFAVPAHAGTIAENYYPECADITLFSDSALLPFKRWKKIARETWRCDEPLWQAIHSDNITLDWYEALHAKYGGRFKYLYAGSIHDYLLSTFYNDVKKGKYKTNREIQELFFEKYRVMVAALREMEPDYGFYVSDRKNLILSKGGTVHTTVREPYFHVAAKHGCSMAQWLYDAVNGNIYSVGTELLIV